MALEVTHCTLESRLIFVSDRGPQSDNQGTHGGSRNSSNENGISNLYYFIE